MSLPERAREYALRDGPDYGAWDLADLCREYEADTGEPVRPGDLAFEMLEMVAADYRADLENLTQPDDWEEDAAREHIRAELKDIERVQNGIEAAERGERVARADVRALLSEWGVRPPAPAVRRGGVMRGRDLFSEENCRDMDDYAEQMKERSLERRASTAPTRPAPALTLPPSPRFRPAPAGPPSDDVATVRPPVDPDAMVLVGRAMMTARRASELGLVGVSPMRPAAAHTADCATNARDLCDCQGGLPPAPRLAEVRGMRWYAEQLEVAR